MTPKAERPEFVVQMETEEARALAMTAGSSIRSVVRDVTNAATDLVRLSELRPDLDSIRRAAVALFDLAEAARDIERVAALTHRSLTFERVDSEPPTAAAWPDRNLPA